KPRMPALRRRLRPLALATLSSLCLAAGPGEPAIQVNQVGFLPGAAKWAAVPAVQAARFTVLEDVTGRELLSGTLGPPKDWPAAERALRLADFSALVRPGTYRLHVDGVSDSPRFV